MQMRLRTRTVVSSDDSILPSLFLDGYRDIPLSKEYSNEDKPKIFSSMGRHCKEVSKMISEESNFPDYYTIDDLGLDSLMYFLRKEFEGKTVKISVELEEE